MALPITGEGDAEDMSKWIEFHKVDPPIKGRKTDTYLIFTKTEDEIVIGEIRWHGPWRQYSFFPQPNCVFEKTCLKDITDFIIKLMEDRKK